MPSSRRNPARGKQSPKSSEVCDFTQLGLDFAVPIAYCEDPRKEPETMNQELFAALDTKVCDLIEKYSALKSENARLIEENQRLTEERTGLKSQVDAILAKLDGV